MLPPNFLQKAIQKNAFRLLALSMIAVLLAGTAFVVQPAGKALAAGYTCTSAGDGDWSSSSVWSCPGAPAGYVPSGTDDVLIGAATVTGVLLTSDQSVHNLTIDAGGSLIFSAPVTLTITGDFSVTASGLFDPGNSGAGTGGTVVMGGSGNQTINANGQTLDFFNLTKVTNSAGQSLSFTPSGVIHILNNTSLVGSAAYHLVLQSTTPGSQWSISPDGSAAPNIDFVNVQDSDNISPTTIYVPHGKDLGNNTGWVLVPGMISIYLPKLTNNAEN